VKADAYVNYHKGTELLRRTSGSQTDLAQAVNYFEMAIAADSSYSQAWAGMADAFVEYVFWHRAADGDAIPRAAKAARKALEYDPDLGEAYGTLGAIDLYTNDLKSAEKNLLKAIDLSPGYAPAYERLAWVRFFTGNSKEGFGLLEKVIHLDPLSTRSKGLLGNGYYLTQRYDEGITRLKKFLELHPGDNFILWSLAYLHVGKGDYPKAIEYLDMRTLGKGTNWIYAFCYARLGDKEAAHKILEYHLERKNTGGFVPDFMMASVYESNGMPDEAIASLERATGTGGESFFSWQLGTDPMFASMRDDPRFKRIVDKIHRMYQY
jgi:tetratricopeptide (TPR) repeat protein